MTLAERARIGLEFETDEAQRDFRAAMLDPRMLVGDVAVWEAIEFPDAASRALRGLWDQLADDIGRHRCTRNALELKQRAAALRTPCFGTRGAC